MTTPAATSIWHNHDFTKIWAGETVSLIGNQITVFALPLVAILTLHASVIQVGILSALRLLPVVIFSLLAGVWLDRRRRRPIMIACSVGNGLLIGLVPLCSAFDALSMPLLYAVTFLVGALSVVFDVGVLTYMPSVVDREHLSASNSRMQSSLSLSMIAGPGLAGVLIGILTAPITLTADAVSYFCSAAGLISIRKPEPPPEVPAERPTIRASIAEGLRAVYGHPILRNLLGLSGTFNFVQAGFATIFVVYGIRDLHLSAFQLGVVLGFIAIGGLIGASCTQRIAKRFGVGPTMLVGLGSATLFPALLLIPRGNGLAAVIAMCAIHFCYGFCVLTFNVHSITVRQVVTPNRLLGRMNASYRLVLFGTSPPGAFIAGALGESFGLRTALVIGVIAFPMAIGWTLMSPVFKLKELPDGPDDKPSDTPGPEEIETTLTGSAGSRTRTESTHE
jgi:MFS family permease